MKFRVTDIEMVQDILDTILTEIGVFSSHKVTTVHFFSATRRIVGGTWSTALLNHVGDRNLASTPAERMRHTFASHLVMAGGVDLVTVKDLLGHTGTNMTVRYSHLVPEYKAQAVASWRSDLKFQLKRRKLKARWFRLN